jgi:hypothetical protein
MRQAQTDFAGADLRRLAQERQRAVATLVQWACQLAGELGKPVSEASVRELETTLEAASADAEAGDALRRGRLTTALHSAGFGAAWAGDHVSAPSRPATAKPKAPRSKAEESDGGRHDRAAVEHAGQALRDAEYELADVERQVRSSERRLRDLLKTLDRDREKVSTMEERLRVARQDVRDAEGALHRAEVERAAAERTMRTLRQRVIKAQGALDRATAARS